MVKIGQVNQLRVIKEVAFGIYLDGNELGDILLPKKYVPKDTQLDQLLEVFIYFDSEDRVIATTLRPKIQFECCGFLKVIDVNRVGAFLDWGLDKDLLVPRSEQQRPMEKNKSYLVYSKLDNQGRIIASSKLDHFLSKNTPEFKQGEEVDLWIAETTHLGTKVIVNNSHWGLIHSSDIFQILTYGKRIKGYIKTIRDDGKIDVVLRKTGQSNIQDLSELILSELNKNAGFLPLHDKSAADEIMRIFKDSKKNFKSAIGQLYKRGKIIIEAQGIRLVDKS